MLTSRLTKDAWYILEYTLWAEQCCYTDTLVVKCLVGTAPYTKSVNNSQVINEKEIVSYLLDSDIQKKKDSWSSYLINI